MAVSRHASATAARSSSTPASRHFDHGYAVTSHSSQGLTAERVLVHADTSVHPDLLNSRFAYVSISRASHEATLFTDDMAKLGPQLGADVFDDLRPGNQSRLIGGPENGDRYLTVSAITMDEFS